METRLRYPVGPHPPIEYYGEGFPCFICFKPMDPDERRRKRSFCSPECYVLALLTPERWIEESKRRWR